MKKISLLIIAITVSAVSAIAQVSYGVRVGVNLSKINNYLDGPDWIGGVPMQTNNTSFHITGYADIPIVSNLSIQPGISLQGKGTKYYTEPLTTTIHVLSVELPINAVYTIPVGDIGGFFLGTGPYVGVNVSGKRKTVSDETSDSRDWKFTGDRRNMKLITFGMNFLGGFKFRNGFLVNAGYGLDLMDLNPRDNLGSAWYNRVLSIGVGYQF